MGTYALLNLALNVAGTVLEHEDLINRLQEEEAKGTPESEIPGLIRKWRDEEIAKTQQTLNS